MKKKSIYPSLWRAVAVTLALLLLLLTVTACGDKEAEARIRLRCETVLNGLIAKDLDTAHAVLSGVTEEEFLAFANEIAPLLQDVTSYELKQVGWHFRTENGITQTTMTYRMVCSNDIVYLIEASETTGVEGLSGFHIQLPETAANNAAPLVLQILFGALSLAATAFCIWMIVDCARRKIKKKALWILLILVGVIFSVTVGGGNLNFRTTLGLLLSRSRIYADSLSGAVQVALFLPLGAIVYAVLRRSLTLSDPPIGEEEQMTETEQE